LRWVGRGIVAGRGDPFGQIDIPVIAHGDATARAGFVEMLQQVGAAAAGPDGAVLHLVVGGMHLLDEGAPWAAGRAAATAVTIRNLEGSFGRADPRALIQMATGSVKAFTAVNISYRLLKFAAAKRNCGDVEHSDHGRAMRWLHDWGQERCNYRRGNKRARGRPDQSIVRIAPESNSAAHWLIAGSSGKVEAVRDQHKSVAARMFADV